MAYVDENEQFDKDALLHKLQDEKERYMSIKRGIKNNTYDVSIQFQIEVEAPTAKDAERIAANNWRKYNLNKNFKLQVDWPFGDSIAETDEEKELELIEYQKELWRSDSTNYDDDYWEDYFENVKENEE